jgi:hypothetical protein
MRPFVFRCPVTGLNVQAETDSEPPLEGQANVYEGIACLACRGFHMVNPHTGKMPSEEGNDRN